MSKNLKLTIQKIFDNHSFSQKEAEKIMNIILNEKPSDAQLAAFLTAFRLKGEELPELTGMAKILKKVATKITLNVRGVVDTSSTGGSLMDTFNISTLAAFVAAGAGVPVAKQIDHSAMGGKCSSADLLEQLGVKVDLEPPAVKKCLQALGIGFLFAPIFHPKIDNILRVRKEIGIRTVFNVLWPLINPVKLSGQLIGVYNEKLTTLVASVLRNLGVKTALVVHGVEGLDEISVTGRTRVSELRKGLINTYTISPEDFNMQSASISYLVGGSAEENAKMSKVILSGKEQSPRTDAVLLNAAAAIVAGSKAATIKDGLMLAQKSLYSGAAAEKLQRVIAFTQKYAKRKTKKKK